MSNDEITTKGLEIKEHDFGSFTVVRDTVISNTGVRICNIILTPRDTKRTRIKLYDGSSNQDRLIIDIMSGTSTSKIVNFNHDLITQNGLFIKCDGDIENCLIQYHTKRI